MDLNRRPFTARNWENYKREAATPLALPREELVWEQFQRIIAHPLFNRAANHQAFLREIIKRLYAGSDDFAAKVLAAEIFGRDTSIAKVEGRSVREKLETYNSGDGRNDPIRIRIPARTFKPEIQQAVLPPDSLPGMMRLQALEYQKVPSQDNYYAALQTLVKALAWAPSHPLIMGTKALVHAQRAIYAEDPRVELEIAEYLVRDVYERDGYCWEAALAKGAIHTSRSQWQEAEEAFSQASRFWVEFRPTHCSPWHLLFLASQRRFTEAIEIISGILDREPGRACDLDAELAMMYILAGDLDGAQRVIDEARSFYEPSFDFHYFFPAVLGTLFAAKGQYASAEEALLWGLAHPPSSILGSAEPGLRVLFAGLARSTDEAEVLLGDILRLRHDQDRARPSRKDERIPAFHCALAALGANKLDLAVGWLEIAVVREREPLGLWIHILPFFRPLHGHAGFLALVSKMRLSIPVKAPVSRPPEPVS